MKSRQRRSRKRSVASSIAAKRLEGTVFYLDESIYSRALYERMVALRANVERAGVAFPFGTPDVGWLSACGERHWVALTRDKNIRRRALERQAIRDFRVGAFVFVSREATAAETAGAVGRLLNRFVNIATSEPWPFLRTFGLGSHIGRVKL